jgi:hypothetical protein
MHAACMIVLEPMLVTAPLPMPWLSSSSTASASGLVGDSTLSGLRLGEQGERTIAGLEGGAATEVRARARSHRGLSSWSPPLQVATRQWPVDGGGSGPGYSWSQSAAEVVISVQVGVGASGWGWGMRVASRSRRPQESQRGAALGPLYSSAAPTRARASAAYSYPSCAALWSTFQIVLTRPLTGRCAATATGAAP